MSKLKDLTGMKFGRLTVIERSGSKNRKAAWLCKCECGNKTAVSSDHLTGRIPTHSCGCLRQDVTIKRNFVHGGRRTRLYSTWTNMRTRTSNPNNKSYINYGGRGIKICDEWKNDFAAFRDWAMANGYDDRLSIDRIDNDGNYEPSNCRWADDKAQANNKRRNRFITVGNVTHTMAEWSRKTGISYGKIKDRLASGWVVERALGMVA